MNFTMQPTDYIIGPASGDPNLCLAWPQAQSPQSDGIDWHIGMLCVDYAELIEHSDTEPDILAGSHRAVGKMEPDTTGCVGENPHHL